MASQIADQFKLFGTNLKVRVELVTGGQDQTKQSVLLSDLPHIIVATPGRLADLIKSTDLRLNKERVKIRVSKMVYFSDYDRLQTTRL